MLQSLASNSCVRLIQNHKSTWYFVSLVLGYLLFLIFGAVVFSSVELPYEDQLRQELRAVKQQFLQENGCITEERLERFLKKALDASNYGVSILNNASVNWNWDFTSALFFASTVLSTTGKCRSLSTNSCILNNNVSSLYIFFYWISYYLFMQVCTSCALCHIATHWNMQRWILLHIILHYFNKLICNWLTLLYRWKINLIPVMQL